MLTAFEKITTQLSNMTVKELVDVYELALKKVIIPLRGVNTCDILLL